MAAGKYDIVIDQGSDFSLQIQIAQDGSNINLVNQTASAQLRPSPTSNTLTATFTCSTVDQANGVLKMYLGYGATRNVAAGKYYYDLELHNSSANTTTRLIEGIARVTPEVTR